MITSQIIRQTGTLGTNVIISYNFDQMNHRSGDAVLVKAMCNYGFFSGDAGGGAVDCEFGVIAKPLAIGSPILADFSEEKYMIGKTHKMCFARRSVGVNDESDQIDTLHFDASLKIRIPLDWRVYMAVLNGAIGTNLFRLLTRLFWTII